MNNSADWPQIRRQTVPNHSSNPTAVEFRRLGLILLVALLHGVAFIFLIPPWQHYDEPNHFERVWLVAYDAASDFDPQLSYRVLESMHHHGFYANSAQPPALPAADDSLRLPGYSQLGEPRLYYLLAGLPGRIFAPLEIERQLYAARFVSLALYLLTVLSAWGAARALTLPGHPLRWLAPAFLALLPGLAELMTAVNNDALAIAAASLFFWGAARLLGSETSLLNLAWVFAAAALAFFSKNTAFPVIALLPLVMLFAFLRGRLRPAAWAILLGGLAALLVFGFAWDDAASWYRGSSQQPALRQASVSAIHGAHMLGLDPAAPVVPGWSPPVYQVIPPGVARPAFGQSVSLGVWMWADQPVTARTPRLGAGTAVFSKTVQLSTEPQFFAYTAILPAASDRIWIALDPQPNPQGSAGMIYYDNLALSLGEMDVNTSPVYMDEALKTGIWGETPFENLARNPSFEIAGVRVRPWLDNLAVRFLPDNARPSQLLASLVDGEGAGYFYRSGALHLFNTFWARFGWGHVALVWKQAYWIPTLITLLAGIGLVVGVVLRRGELPWDVIALMALALAGASMLALTRGAAYLALPGYYYSTARHAYPVILPAGLALTAGWLGLAGRSSAGRTILLILMAALALISFYSVWVYYAGR